MSMTQYIPSQWWVLVPKKESEILAFQQRHEALPVSVVLGLMYGDEWKWKITEGIDAHSVRFNGWHNAGHTVVTWGESFDLHILPSSIVSPHKKAIIARTCVLWINLPKIKPSSDNFTPFVKTADGDIVCLLSFEDLIKRSDNNPIHVGLIPELNQIGKKWVAHEWRLFISKYVPLIGIHHVLMDALSEAIRENIWARKIWSTGSGIAPAYGYTATILEHGINSSASPQSGYRELHSALSHLSEKRSENTLDMALNHPTKYLEFVEAEWKIIQHYFPYISFDLIKELQLDQIEKLRIRIEWAEIRLVDERDAIRTIIKNGWKIVWEWAQAALISRDQSIYGTSSNPNIQTFCEATGITPDQIANIYAVMKLPPSSVGTRPIGFMKYPETLPLQNLREKYSEFGVSTGRPRDLVKISLVEISRAVELILQGTTWLEDKMVPVFNRIDGLSDFSQLTGGKIPLVTWYIHNVWAHNPVWAHSENFGGAKNLDLTPANLLLNYPNWAQNSSNAMFNISQDSSRILGISGDMHVSGESIWVWVSYLLEYILSAMFASDKTRDVILGTWPKREDLIIASGIKPYR